MKEFRRAPDPLEFYRHLKKTRGTAPSVLLESARRSPQAGRYSIAAADPFLVFEARGRKVKITRRGGLPCEKEADPFFELKNLLRENSVSNELNFPPFAGGAIGFVGYEAKNLIESRLLSKSAGSLGLPDLYFMFFDEGVVFDHQKGKTTAFISGILKNSCRKEFERAEIKFKSFEKMIANFRVEGNGKRAPRARPPSFKSSMGLSAFMKAVRAAKRYIQKGDIFQANLSQRFEFPLEADPLQVYRALRDINPSSFFGVLDAGDFQILSGSPERLVRLQGNILETRPIAGTRSRGRDSRQDALLAEELLLSPKERAEHIMLVDLERNDLGRVAAYGSVRVDEFMALEDYSHVKHIVSNVRGRLREGVHAVDAFKAFFPGGTITGAPKVRCMEIIDKLEPVARGPYTGSMGYFSFTGNMDFNIIIRSLVVQNRKGYLHAGAGIVADSIPRKEYEETLYKAEAVLEAVFGRKLKPKASRK